MRHPSPNCSQVTDDDYRLCETRYTKAKDVHSIMQHVARC